MGNDNSTSTFDSYEQSKRDNADIFKIDSTNLLYAIDTTNFMDSSVLLKIFGAMQTEQTKQTELIGQTEQTKQTGQTDPEFYAFEQKIKFFMLDKLLESKSFGITIDQIRNNITTQHVKMFAETYDFKEWAEEIESVMPNKFKISIPKPLIWPFESSISRNKKERTEYDTQIDELKAKYIKNIDPNKFKLSFAKNLFKKITDTYADILNRKETFYLFGKMKGFDFSDPESLKSKTDNEINSFIDLIEYDQSFAIQSKKFKSLSCQKKLEFIRSSENSIYSKRDYSDSAISVLASLNLTDDKSNPNYSNYINFLSILFDCIDKFDSKQINELLNNNFEFDEIFRNNKAYSFEYDKIKFEWYKNIYYPSLSEKEQNEQKIFKLDFADQFMLYKLNEKLYVKMLCNFELILNTIFKSYEVDNFCFLDCFSEATKNCLMYKIKLDTDGYESIDDVKYPELNTIDDLIDYLVFALDPPNFLYKKDLLDMHPNNIKLFREILKEIGFDQNKYNYKNYKLVMSLVVAKPEELEDIVNVAEREDKEREERKKEREEKRKISDDSDEEFDIDPEEAVEADEADEAEEEAEHYTDPLKSKFDKAVKYYNSKI